MAEKNINQVAIVGAGPAGLTAALTAQKLGLAVKVFEQAADFKQVGGGIGIHSNGQRVLNALGLLESFLPSMVLVEKGTIEGLRGKILAEIDFTELDIPFNQMAVILRYQLQEHLLAAAEKAGIEVKFDCRLENLNINKNRAELKFENGAENIADIVVAADGVNSRVREASGINFQKITVGEGWIRGLSDYKLSDRAFREIWGDDGRRFGIAPLTDDKLYFYARVPLGKWETIRENSLDEWIESWRDFKDAAKILQNVENWQKVNYSELFEIRADNWAKPPVFLVGDAAHSMTPNVGQGANSAMVDALVLMRMLAGAEKTGKPYEEVGREYTALRRPFVTKTQTMARQTGKLAANISASAHLLRDILFATAKHLGFLRRKSMQFSTGFHPPENEFFTPF